MTVRTRAAVTIVCCLGALAGSLERSARAQTPTTVPTTVATTVPLLQDLLNKLVPTTAPPPPPTTAPPPTSTVPAPTSPSGDDSPAPEPDQAACAATAAGSGGGSSGSAPRNTGTLLDALARLGAPGRLPDEVIVGGMGRFPVGGRASYSDDWLAPRFTPCFHLHRGTDIFADRGTPVRAPDGGVVHFAEEPVGGKVAGVTTGDGTYYYLAHLQGFAPGVRSGSVVKRGEIVGYVGSSGNAAGSSPHTHFQIHPRGGAPVNPKPMLDAWLDEALAGAGNVIIVPPGPPAPRSLTALAMLRQFGAAGRAGEPETDRWRRATELAEALLAPLTPAPLNSILRKRGA